MIKKLICLLSILGIISLLSAQDDLPILHTDSAILDIRVGEEIYFQGGWYLNPEANPDIFHVGSKWYYTQKMVSFVSNRDSISFSIEPGESVDFLILLDQKTSFPTRIIGRPNPRLWEKRNLYILLILIIGLGVGIVIWRKKVSRTFLLASGIACPILFWVLTWIAGYFLPDYQHLNNSISELGELGNPVELSMSFGGLAIACLSVLFAIGMYRYSQEKQLSPLPAIFTLPFSFAMGWAAIFPLGNYFHGILGPMPLLLFFSPIAIMLQWKKVTFYHRISRWAILSCILMALLFLRFAGPMAFTYAGLIQRFFYAGWTVWYVGVALILLAHQAHE